MFARNVSTCVLAAALWGAGAMSSCAPAPQAACGPDHCPDCCVDAGVEPLSGDGGEADAGLTLDSGTPDAGSDAGVEDGGCEGLPHHPKLGTLQLQPGFTAEEAAPLATGISAVTSVGQALFGLSSVDHKVYPLGTWPQLSKASQALFDVVSSADQGESVFLGPYLENDGQRLLAGYTKSGASFPGTVALYELQNPNHTTYLSAPGNYSAAGVPGGGFVINSTGLDSLHGSAVYGLLTASAPYQARTLATFDPAWMASSGYTALTSDGVAVLGYFHGGDFQNHLRAVSPASYLPALNAQTPVALDAHPEVYAGSDLFAVTGFGAGLALHRGGYDAATFAPVTSDLSWLPLSVNGATVTAGTLTPIALAPDTCTRVVLMSAKGPDLLLGVQDQNGARLVRITHP